MKVELDSNSLQDEAFRKIGGNVFNFQKIEHLLKVLIANAQTSGWAHNFQENQIARRDKIAQKTMGTLAGEFFSSTVKCSDDDEKHNRVVKEPTFSTSLNLENEFHEEKRREIEMLVNERNELIHQRLIDFNPTSIQDCQDLIAYLDSQRERQIIAYDFLKYLATIFVEYSKDMAEYMGSEEFQKEFGLLFLAQSPIVRFLIAYTQEQQKNDGWTFLSAAISRISKELPGDLEKIKNDWGYKKIIDLIRDFDFFEIKKEPLSNNTYRWLYRVVSPESLIEYNETKH